MSNELAIPQDNVAKVSDEFFKELTSASDFLARFTLYGSNSDACKRGLIPVGQYGYTKDGKTIVNCGNQVHCFVLAFRYKAMDLSGDTPKSYHNPKSEDFERIRLLSGDNDNHCLCGPEFLLFLPKHNCFVTFFMASKTMRREAPNVKMFCPTVENPQAKPATFHPKFIEKGTYSWHGPEITECSFALETPDAESLVKELTKFHNPVDSAPKASVEDKKKMDRAR